MAIRFALALALGLSLVSSALGPTSSMARAPGRHAGRKHRATTIPAPEVSLAPSVAGGIPVTTQPVGLSLEYPAMAQDLGTGTCPPPALVAQLQALGSPPLSLAGDSQDMTAPSGAAPSPPTSWETTTLYTLPANFWSQLQCLLGATKDPLTVGLNARTGDLAWAQQMVAGAQSAVAAGESLDFSLGNEPDLYELPNYAALDKPQPEEEAVDVNTYLRIAAYLQPALDGAPVIGPELARPAHWQRELPRVIAALHEQTVGVHLYPLSSCETAKAVTIGGLLSAQAGNSPRSLQWVVADADAAGVPAIISEANSASCGGVAGVSDSPAAAVWAVRFVLSALKTGFREVRFHFSGGPYDPFVVQGEQVLARPLASALVGLNQWLPVGASLRTLALAGAPGLVATSVREPSGATVLILDNEHAHAQAVVVRGAPSVSAQTLSASRSGLSSAALVAQGGRVRLAVPANSVIALAASS